jgi:DUF2950 family protein
MASRLRLLSARLAIGVALFGSALPAGADPTTFATPEAGVAALTSALATDDVDALIALFGREHADIVLGVDPVSGRVMRQLAAAAAREKVVLRQDEEGQLTLVFGRNDWPMPVPLVRRDDRWMFDAALGGDEIMARRIGEDELAAIDALKTFVSAERSYARWRRARRLPVEYARYVQSTPGRTDGLWWDEATAAKAGASRLAGFATRNRDFLEGRRPGDPFRGYYYRVLTGQGAHAPGGAMSFLADGRMTKGFAMIAWPADYGASGIKTFIVGPDGRVLEKDLGEETGALAEAILRYDPDEGWTAAER